jgi:hypothetical protein
VRDQTGPARRWIDRHEVVARVLAAAHPVDEPLARQRRKRWGVEDGDGTGGDTEDGSGDRPGSPTITLGRVVPQAVTTSAATTRTAAADPILIIRMSGP